MTVFNTASIYPVQILGNDFQTPAGEGNPLSVTLGTASFTATISGVVLGNSTASIGNVTAILASGTSVVSISQVTPGTTNRVQSGNTTAIALTLTISTTTAYNPNQSIGGIMSFANAFPSTNGGILQTIDLNFKTIQTAAFIFFPFNANPSTSTFTDHAATVISAADVFSVRDPVTLATPVSNLGTHTNYSAQGLGIAMNPGTTTLYAVMIAATQTTAAMSTTGDIQIVIKTLQD